MNKDKFFYFGLLVVLIITLLLLIFVQMPDILSNFLSLIFIGSLISFLFESWRDKREHERQLEIQSREQDYSLSITSQMALKIFDRQVEFCESYFEKSHAILNQLFDEGPTRSTIQSSKELFDIRIKYSPWLTSQIEIDLLPFEKALRSIGSIEIIEPTLRQSETRGKLIEKMYDTFNNIINIDIEPNNENTNESIIKVISHLRKVLNTDKLTNLRDKAVDSAALRITIN
jgi:hypothetical protein